MSCDQKSITSPSVTANKWVSAINFVVGQISPTAGVVTGQFAIATQTGASAVALANGDGTAPTAIPGVSISAPTMAWFAKVGGWISVMAKAAGVVVPGVGAIAVGMTLISAVAAALANKTFNGIVTDPVFWDALGSGSPDSYLQSTYGLSIDDLMNTLWEALLSGKIQSLDACPKDFQDAKRWLWPRDPLILDLDGDGLETVGPASNVYFDHDGDGVLTQTGWVAKDDALLDLDRYANGFLSGTNWVGLADFDTLIDILPKTPGIAALLDEFKLQRLTADDDTTGFTDKAGIVLSCGYKSRRWWGGEATNTTWRVAA